MSKDLIKVALDTINLKYGKGAERKDALNNAGYDYNEVQSLVNDIVKDMTPDDYENLRIGIATDYENTLNNIYKGRG